MVFFMFFYGFLGFIIIVFVIYIEVSFDRDIGPLHLVRFEKMIKNEGFGLQEF